MTYYTMCAHVREETGLSEGFPLADVADMHFDHRYFALFHGIPQCYAGMRVPARVEDDPLNIIKRSVTIERHSRAHSIIRSLYPINEVSLVVGLLIDKMHLRPDSLDI